MSKIPPIPREQQSLVGDKVRDRLRSAEPDLRDDTSGLPSHHADMNLRRQGQQANIRQNTHYQQDR